MSPVPGSDPNDGGGSPVDAVVVTFNSATEIGPCVESLVAAGVRDVVVVDNDSSDGSVGAARAAGARVIRASGNVGFGRAVNIGVAATSAPAVLVANPDLVVVADAVERLAGTLDEDGRTAVVGPRVDLPGGARYPSARRFPSLLVAIAHAVLSFVAPRNRWSRDYRRDDWDPETAESVDWVSGTAMLVRRAAFDEVGGFDPAFFMYVEDVDLCWRLRQRGWDVVFEPRAVVVHEVGRSSESRPVRMIVAHHVSLWRFARRSSSGPERLALPVVAVGLVARSVVAVVERLWRRRPGALR